MDFDGSIEVPAGQDLQEWTLSLPARAGVYFLWGEGKEPILLATSGSVRAVVRRKLAGGSEQTAGRRAELDKITKGVSWTEANSNFVAYLQFHRLAREIYPQSYRQMLGWPDAWWVKISFSGAFGRLLSTRRLTQAGPDEFVGPWPNGKSAKNFVELATDLFGLCRNHELLQSVGESGQVSKTCTYAQIDKCCGVCEGKISAEQYRTRLLETLRLSEPGGRRGLRQELGGRMKIAAGEMRFEEAAKIKNQLGRLTELEKEEFRWVDSLRRFQYLIIAPGKDRRQLRPWRVNGGAVEASEPFVMSETKQRIGDIVDWAGQGQDCQVVEAKQLEQWQESISLLSYFLFRSHSEKCLYYKLGRLGSPGRIAEQIEKNFARRATRGVKPVSREQENSVLKESPNCQ